MTTEQYGPILTPLIEKAAPMPLGPGHPDKDHKNILLTLTPADAFAHAKLIDMTMGQACIAGILLLHNFAHESHEISQNLETDEGSYWHGILHRREPDYWNSKYWFRQVGDHPILQTIAEEVETNVENRDEVFNRVLKKNCWNPQGFVDLVEECIHVHHELHPICMELQMIEWKALFDYCYQGAISG